MVQFETSSCIIDGKSNYKEYHEKIVKVDNGKTDKFPNKDGLKEPNGFSVVSTQGYEISRIEHSDEVSTKRKSFKLDPEEKIQESMRMCGLSPLVPCVNFNENIIPQTQKRKSTVIRLSFKRKSVDGEETNEVCKYA